MNKCSIMLFISSFIPLCRKMYAKTLSKREINKEMQRLARYNETGARGRRAKSKSIISRIIKAHNNEQEASQRRGAPESTHFQSTMPGHNEEEASSLAMVSSQRACSEEFQRAPDWRSPFHARTRPWRAISPWRVISPWRYHNEKESEEKSESSESKKTGSCHNELSLRHSEIRQF